MESTAKRPVAITIICVLMGLGLLEAVFILFAHVKTGFLTAAGVSPFLLLIGIGIGAVSVYGFWTMQRWAFYFYLIVYPVMVMLNLVVSGGGVKFYVQILISVLLFCVVTTIIAYYYRKLGIIGTSHVHSSGSASNADAPLKAITDTIDNAVDNVAKAVSSSKSVRNTKSMVKQNLVCVGHEINRPANTALIAVLIGVVLLGGIFGIIIWPERSDNMKLHSTREETPGLLAQTFKEALDGAGPLREGCLGGDMDACLNACHSGNAIACVVRGRWEDKRGIKDQASVHFTIACSGGNLVGCVDLGILKEELGYQDDAKIFYRKACAGGNMDGCNFLGHVEFQLGYYRDARDSWTRACNGGEIHACDNLRRLTRMGH